MIKRLLAGLFSLLVALPLGAQQVNYPQPLTLGQDRAAPFNLVGQLDFFSGTVEYVGSGTVVRPSSVLTAGPNVYDQHDGWSTKVIYRLGNYGNKVIASQKASRLLLLSGYRQAADAGGADDINSFARDTAGLIFPNPVAAGKSVNVSYASSLLSSAYYRIAVGYGAEGNHSGDYPLYVKPTSSFVQTKNAFYENYSIYFEGGMSGGPLFAYYQGKPFVLGVVVSGAVDPDAGGIRIIDMDSFHFVYQWLK